MIRLHVFVTLPGGESVLAGDLVVADPDDRGALTGQFRYSGEFLGHPEAFPLDPLRLPLAEGIFDANRPQAGVHGAFEDSLPDDWGRRILVRRYRLGRTEQRVPNLLRVLGAKGLGALSFSDADVLPSVRPQGVASRHLVDLLRLAETFERSEAGADEELALLFQAGSSPGGARPKVVVEESGQAWLAKFPSVRDRVDVVRLEAATMALAGRAGVDVAPTRLEPCGIRDILLVERFDVTPAGGRNHVVSMQTLLGADGHYSSSYRDLAEVVRRISAAPGADLLKLYRQMLFHAVIGNTDDHLKNFCMLHGATGWRLSPAFDILPNIGGNREHVLRMGNDYLAPGRAVLLAEAKFFGVKRTARAAELIDETMEVVRGWRTLFAEIGVPDADCQVLAPDIEGRLARISG